MGGRRQFGSPGDEALGVGQADLATRHADEAAAPPLAQHAIDGLAADADPGG